MIIAIFILFLARRWLLCHVFFDSSCAVKRMNQYWYTYRPFFNLFVFRFLPDFCFLAITVKTFRCIRELAWGDEAGFSLVKGFDVSPKLNR